MSIYSLAGRKMKCVMWCAAIVVGAWWSFSLNAAERKIAEYLPVIQVPLVAEAPVVDGDLSDPVWKKASKTMRFRFLSCRMNAPRETTEAWMLTTTDTLFIAFRCHESQIERGLYVTNAPATPLFSKTQPRDTAIWEDDSVEVVFKPGADPEGDYYQFVVNGFSTIGDSFKGDDRWNAKGYRSAAKIDTARKEWIIEMAIPFADLELPRNKEVLAGGWQFNLTRQRIAREDSPVESTAWSPTNGRDNLVPGMLGYVFFEVFGGKAPYERPVSLPMPYPEDPAYSRAYRAPAQPEIVADRASIEAGFGLREVFEKAGGYARPAFNRAKATVLDVNRKAPVALPLSGAGLVQVSGLRVEVNDKGEFIAPEQVCTLVFQQRDAYAVVRVWENKEHRIFVSAGTGDDTNPGTEAKPLKSIFAGIHAAAKDPEAGIYLAGGEYHEAQDCNLPFNLSLYGGFDEAGWLRDPIIQEPVLLPHGFRENWVDDMCERFKDLRRAEHRFHETKILPHIEGTNLVGTLVFGWIKKGSGKEVTRDTFIDGLSVFGCPDKGPSQPPFFTVRGRQIVRNCILVTLWSNEHAYIPNPGGSAGENNIVWDGIFGRENHTRPQMVYDGQHYRRNLIVGGTGGDYTRMFLCWYRGGVVEENQIHGGNSFGWSTMSQGYHRAKKADADYVFSNNLVRTDFLTKGFEGQGFVAERNIFYPLKGGFETLLATRTLRVANNRFYFSNPLTEGRIFPTGERMTIALGGTWNGEAYLPPAGEGTGKPVIQGNVFTQVPFTGRRPPELVSLDGLSWLVAQDGEAAAVRPTSPATELTAVAGERGEVRLRWKPSANADVTGYRIRFGQKSNSWANHEPVGQVTSAVVKGLKPGRWYFTVAAHTKAYVECWTLSNEAEIELR